MEKRKMIAGNWKMNKTNDEALVLVKELLEEVSNNKDKDILIAPPFTALSEISKLIKSSNIKLGAQNMYFEDKGAFTGQISSSMLKSAGCEYVILGHSECRIIFSETDELINKKIKHALEVNLIPIFCVGETLKEREEGLTNKIIDNQIKKGLNSIEEKLAKNIIIAYEPVWAIGTGKTASPEDADKVHAEIRKTLTGIYNLELAQNTRILYGGSMNEENAKSLLSMPNIDGGLIGGASLVASKFSRIVNCAI